MKPEFARPMKRARPAEDNEGVRSVDDCAHRQLGLAGHADLAHEDQIERRMQHLGYLRRHRYAAARQSEYDRILSAMAGEPGGKPAAGITAVEKRHLASVARGTDALRGRMAGRRTEDARQAGNHRYFAVTAIFFSFFWASGDFGSVMASTPFLNEACTLSALMPEGRVKDRSKEP